MWGWWLLPSRWVPLSAQGLMRDYHAFIESHASGEFPGKTQPPSPPSPPEQVIAAEAALGVLFDDEYRNVLLSSDGWPLMEGIHEWGCRTFR